MMAIFNVLAFIFFIFIFIILSFFEEKFSFKTKKKIILIAVLLISIIGAFRVVGSDLGNYKIIFDNSPILNLDQLIESMFTYYYEPLFMLFISIIKQFGLGFKTFLFIFLLIPLFIIYKIVTNKESETPITTFALFLFIYLFSMDIMRHFFAAIIYLSALYSLAANKKWSFYLKSFISVMMHYSNLLIFFIKPLLKIKWSITKYIYTIIIVVLSSILIKDVLFSYIETSNFTNNILLKFQNYLLYYDESYEYVSDLHVVLKFLFQYTIVFLHVFLIIYMLINSKKMKDNFLKLLLGSQILGSIFLIISVIFEANQMGLRINFLLSIGSFFLLKEILFNSKGNRNIIYIFIILYLSFTVFIRVLYNMGIYDPTSSFYLGF